MRELSSCETQLECNWNRASVRQMPQDCEDRREDRQTSGKLPHQGRGEASAPISQHPWVWAQGKGRDTIKKYKQTKQNLKRKKKKKKHICSEVGHFWKPQSLLLGRGQFYTQTPLFHKGRGVPRSQPRMLSLRLTGNPAPHPLLPLPCDLQTTVLPLLWNQLLKWVSQHLSEGTVLLVGGTGKRSLQKNGKKKKRQLKKI